MTTSASTPTEGEGAEVAELRGKLSSALGDDYALGAILGAGRSGVVFVAHSAATKRDVAIKIAWNNAAARAQLARETSLTSEIVHPHVLWMRKLHLGKPIFVVEMPLAPAGTLDDRFEKGGGVSFQYVRAILRQVAGAFDEAHARGIVHGAVCPLKILLDENGQCLVSDFGLRLPIVARSTAPRPSELGSPAYMPLEQRRDRADFDGRADQYALAIIAFELLRGRRTWHVSNEGVVAVEALDLTPTRSIAPGVPLSANAAIKRATASEPAHRYSSVTEFVEAFAGDSSDAVEVRQRRRRPRVNFLRRSWLAAAAVLVLAVAGSRATVRQRIRGLMPADWSFFGGDQADEGLSSDLPDSGSVGTLTTGRRSSGDIARVRRGKAPAQSGGIGVIRVTLTGGNSAFVIIDGQTRGGTPLLWRTNAGHHVVSLRGEDKYSPAELGVNVAGGDTARAAFVATTRR
jgi:serine/threonine protein kinase